MTYSVHLTHIAVKQLDDLPSVIRSEVLLALQQLADTPRPHGCKWIRELESWRMRVGDYRVLYNINDDLSEVTVFRIQDRKDVYRKR
ncbi:MAG: type II toxin-antitoxin system RelE family toxin [Anaerolineae bacterium]